MTDNNWQPCPEGEIESLASGLRDRAHRRSMFLSTVAVGTLLLLTGFTIVVNLPRPASAPIQMSITCTECLELYNEYSGGHLSKDKKHAVESHLSHCPYCREQYKTKQNRKKGEA